MFGTHYDSMYTEYLVGCLLMNPTMTSGSPDKLVEYAFRCSELVRKKQKALEAKEQLVRKKREIKTMDKPCHTTPHQPNPAKPPDTQPRRTSRRCICR
jgi:hypothetical protein